MERHAESKDINMVTQHTPISTNKNFNEAGPKKLTRQKDPVKLLLGPVSAMTYTSRNLVKIRERERIAGQS